MSLATDLAVHRDRILADLIIAHDYYRDTKGGWAIIQQLILSGRQFTIRNGVTGNITTEKELPTKLQLYVTDFLASATFEQFVSIFEDFFFGLLRYWLLAYPQRLGQKQISVSLVFTAPDIGTLRLAAVENELRELAYRNVRDWFTYLDRTVKLGCPTDQEIEHLAEIKATRDIVVHNRGIVNATYVEKAGRLSRFAVGEKIDIPDSYHRESWELLRKLVNDISNAAIAKAT